MPDSYDAVYEALAAASSPEEVKSVLEKEGCKLSKSAPAAAAGGNPFAKKDDESDSDADPFEKPANKAPPFGKKSMGEATSSVVKKNFAKFGKKDEATDA